VDVVPCDISVAGRVLATFPEKLKEGQRVPDNLSYLGEICKTVCDYRHTALVTRITSHIISSIFLSNAHFP
jgi:monomeric isocitrate dehydrogenase